MSAVHTPGPWFTSSRSDGGIGPKSNDEDQSFNIVIPVAYIEAFDWPGSFAHNARLIAAAPELLSWLRWSLKHLPDDVKQSGQYEMAQAVIRKATGDAT